MTTHSTVSMVQRERAENATILVFWSCVVLLVLGGRDRNDAPRATDVPVVCTSKNSSTLERHNQLLIASVDG